MSALIALRGRRSVAALTAGGNTKATQNVHRLYTADQPAKQNRKRQMRATGRRVVMLVLATAAIAAVAPAVAQAHHVAGGGAQCTLVGNVPRITAWATFEGF